MSGRRKARFSDRCIVQGGPLHGRIITMGIKRNRVTMREREVDGGLRPYTFERITPRQDQLPGALHLLRTIAIGEVTEYRRPPDRRGNHFRFGLSIYDNDPRHYSHGL